mgnify:CR=1 FL=1|jgi:hypothetical protein
MIYTCNVIEDSDGYQCLEFSDEMMDALDLKVGDTIVWEKNDITGQWSFKKEMRNEER